MQHKFLYVRRQFAETGEVSGYTYDNEAEGIPMSSLTVLRVGLDF